MRTSNYRGVHILFSKTRKQYYLEAIPGYRHLRSANIPEGEWGNELRSQCCIKPVYKTAKEQIYIQAIFLHDEQVMLG